jgi:hypothetical protein
LADGITSSQGIVEETLIQFTTSVMEKIKTALEQAWEVISNVINLKQLLNGRGNVWNA